MLDLLRRSGVTSQRVLDAMEAVRREEFVRNSDRDDAYADRALAIDCQQTISQPLTVALLVQALEVSDGDKVLDVGTGSGYQAAVLAACGGRVTSIERIPDLAESARSRLQRLGFHVDVHVGDGGLGFPDAAPYDAIAIAAAVPTLPVTLVRQLSTNGRLVVPIAGNNDIDQLTRVRMNDGQWLTDDLGAFRFVPLIGHGGYSS